MTTSSQRERGGEREREVDRERERRGEGEREGERERESRQPTVGELTTTQSGETAVCAGLCGSNNTTSPLCLHQPLGTPPTHPPTLALCVYNSRAQRN